MFIAGGCDSTPNPRSSAIRPSAIVPPNALARIPAAPPAAPRTRFTRRYDTIAHEILDLESYAAPVDQSMYDTLDSIIDQALLTIKPRPWFHGDEDRRLYATGVLMQIDDILVQRHFIYPRTGVGVDLLSDGLRPRRLGGAELAALLAQDENARRRGAIHDGDECYVIDCDLTCFVYLAVSEVMGLPVSMVEAPGHNFVRWYIDDADYLNFETIYGVWRGDGEYYSRYFRSAAQYGELLRSGVFLSRMSRDNVLGYALLLRGECNEKQGRVTEAMDDYHHSIALYPRSPIARSRLAWLLVTSPDMKQRDPALAARLAHEAVALWEAPMLLDTLACVEAENGDFAEAVAAEQRAWQLDRRPEYLERARAFGRRQTYFGYLRGKDLNAGK